MAYKNLDFKFISLKEYTQMDEIRSLFKSCTNLNSYIDIDNLQKPTKFYIIKSNNDEDIHKAIKYGIWTSTYFTNNHLSKQWFYSSANGADVYLFYR